MKKLLIFAVAVMAFLSVSVGRAQDPVKVDPKHYTVMTENNDVRVVRIHYKPGEKSAMHSHPKSVAVFLTDARVKMTYPNGKTEEISGKKGQSMFMKATTHQPENIGRNSMEIIQIELKKSAK